MQYREELIIAANAICSGIENRREKILNQIQTHAVNQIKDGYTSFRISKMKKSDERYLKEWADMTKASVKILRFRCFEDSKRYAIKQYIVDLKGSIQLEYELEGKTLIIDI